MGGGGEERGAYNYYKALVDVMTLYGWAMVGSFNLACFIGLRFRDVATSCCIDLASGDRLSRA